MRSLRGGLDHRHDSARSAPGSARQAAMTASRSRRDGPCADPSPNGLTPAHENGRGLDGFPAALDLRSLGEHLATSPWCGLPRPVLQPNVIKYAKPRAFQVKRLSNAVPS